MSDQDPNKAPQNDDDLESLSADEKAAFDKIMAEIAAATGSDPSGGNKPDNKAKTPAPAQDAAIVADTGDAKEAPPSSDTTAIDVEESAADPNGPEPEASTPETGTRDAHDDTAGSAEATDDLDADQQAALDQIMAEIEGKGKGGSAKKEAPAPQPETTDDLDADQQAALDQIMAEIEGKGKGGSAKEAVPAPQPETTDDLDADQQAALDQIMAEIESKGKGGSAKKEAPPQAEADETPDNDQQAALDQIMAEIESQRNGEPDNQEAPAPAAEADEALDEDQQAALDQIMAEIESKRKGEPEKKEAPPPAAETDEALDDDQQAALDQIMSEIESKRKGEPQNKEKAAEAQQASGEEEAPDPEQEAALQNILSEINAKRARSAEKAANPGPDVDELTGQLNAEDEARQNSALESKNQTLSMEEFDAELSNLLSSSQDDDDADTGDDAPKEAAPTEVPPVVVEKGENPPATAELAQPSRVPEEYPVLKEVPADAGKPQNDNPSQGPGPLKRLVPKLILGLALAAAVIVIGVGGLWSYRHFFQDEAPPPVAVAEPEIIPPPEGSPGSEPVQPPAEPAQPTPGAAAPVEAPIVSAKRAELESPAEALAALKSDLASARKQIQSKIFDIQQLKSYYERGIGDEIEKIEDQVTNGQIPSFEKALTNKAIELGLRAIQRRRTYINKLDTPLDQLTAMSEELLFLERRAHTYEILNSGINGLPVVRFKQDAIATIDSYLRYNTQLSIDEVEASPPALTAIWDDILSDLKKKTSLLAQREPLNRAISAEICKGNYERKYQLTALSAETARCLVKWKGKDLYLNALTDLTPEVAEILSQWPGEWLSLNGVRELPAESARHLAQWPGRRLSLNGLNALSTEATAQLSQWKGEQLEMVGLKRIGRWENYGTRLFLSETLRRELEAQLE